MDGHARRLAGWPNGFAIDVRSLAALRTVLALTILADLAMRAPNLRVHYSDEGIVPRPVLLERLDATLAEGGDFRVGMGFPAPCR